MISKFSVKKPYTVLVGVILILVLGFVSFTRMSADLLPDINLPYVIVMTTYVGASPETVETAITVPVESSMATVNNIKSIQSMSSENYSVVILEFEQTANMDSVSLDMREKLDQLESYWPDEIGSPMIMKINPNMLPAMITAVGMDGMTNEEISTFAEEKIIPALESLEGVASVNATGLIEESVHVVIREDKIAKINEKLGALIDEKFEEAYDEINDARKEIGDGERELAKAEKELKNGENKLNDAKKELENGKKELEDKKKETIDQLSNAKLQVLAGKADLEAAKMQSTTNVETAKGYVDGIKKIDEGLATIDMGLVAITSTTVDEASTAAGLSAPADFATMFGVSGTDKLYSEAVSNVMANYQTAAANFATNPDNPLYEGAYTAAQMRLGAIQNQLMDAKGLGAVFDDSTRGKIAKLNFTDAGASVEYLSIYADYVAYLTSTRNTTQERKDALTNQLSGLVGWTITNTYLPPTDPGYEDRYKKLDADLKVYVDTQNGILKTINDNIAALDSKIIELYEGESEALIQFANGMSQMDLAQYQIDTNIAQLDSGKTEIKNGKDQLKDAKDKLDEAEEEIADKIDEAKETADMSGALTVDIISKLLTAQNFSMPAGYVEDDERYLVRVGDKPGDEKELAKMPLLKFPMTDDDIITLEDVADVFSTSNAGDVYTNVNGQPGVILSLQKQTGYSTGDVSETINNKMDDLEKQYDGLSMIPLMDQGIYIDLVMSSIFENVIIGGLLAIIVLMFFLRDIRPTLIIAISIPVSLIAAVVAMYFSGVTLNIISLSGLALGVGMLVDNSIVVIENIYRMRNEGMDAKTASIEGSKEVAGAIFASTLTTVSVFLPIVFTEGMTRQIFVDMGLTIAYSLLASLIIALTVVPAMASKSLRKVKVQKERKAGFFMKAYKGFLEVSLKIKPLVILVAIGLLALSIVFALKRGTAYFPEMESTQIEVNVSLSEDSELTTVGKETDELIEKIRTLNDVVDVGAMASSSQLSMLGGQSTSSSNTTRTSIYVITKEERELTSAELAKEIEAFGEDIEGVDVSVNTSTMDMSALGGSGVTLNIKGRDIDTLYDLANQAAEIIGGTEGIGEVADINEDADPEFRITVDKDKAVKYGLTVAQVFSQVYPHFQEASSATKLVTGAEDLSVFVEDERDDELTLATIKEMPIEYTNDDGKTEKIALKEIATFKSAKGLSTIRRSDQSRMISVSATIADGYNVGLVSQDVEKRMEALAVPKGYSVEFAGENETIMEALNQLILMLILAVVFIYLIMVAQFQSLLSPFIIMFTIPLAFTGGFAALYFTGNEISIVAMIGFVMLSGVIVNNGIVLVDYINQRREAGMSKHDAIIDAGITRLRPVLMTALTTILALLTMAFSKKMGADMTKPLAIVVIGGMVYGTLMTLVIVPCVYDIFMREKKHKDDGPKKISSEQQERLETKVPINENVCVNEDERSGEPVLVTMDEAGNIIVDSGDDVPNPKATIKIPKNANFEIIDKPKAQDASKQLEPEENVKTVETVETKDVADLEMIDLPEITKSSENKKPQKSATKSLKSSDKTKKVNPYMVGWNV